MYEYIMWSCLRARHATIAWRYISAGRAAYARSTVSSNITATSTRAAAHVKAESYAALQQARSTDLNKPRNSLSNRWLR